MARKRRPGGGRKPGGEFPGKSVTFATRLQPETRRALDEAAERTGRSVSAMAETILKAGLRKPLGEPRNQGLAAAVAQLAENIEREAKISWRDSAFVGQALRHALEYFVFHFAPPPEEIPTIPPAIEAASAKMPTAFAEGFRTPAGFGGLLARNLIAEIEQAARDKSGVEHTEWSLPIFLNAKPEILALIASGFGLTPRRRRARRTNKPSFTAASAHR
jgi:hypothetical protein